MTVLSTARHENELSRSTDIASRRQFADRRTTKEVDGAELTGWFTEEVTLADVRTLRAVERTPGLRPLKTPYDGRFGIMTLADVVGLAGRRSTPERPIRVLAEPKHPTWSADQVAGDRTTRKPRGRLGGTGRGIPR